MTKHIQTPLCFYINIPPEDCNQVCFQDLATALGGELTQRVRVYRVTFIIDNFTQSLALLLLRNTI